MFPKTSELLSIPSNNPMKNFLILLSVLIIGVSVPIVITGCDTPVTDNRSSDQKQQEQQETLLKEGTAQTGMPNISHFTERKMMKDILELRDTAGYITYTYLENEYPHAVPGKTAMAGKLTYLGESVGYGLPYATQYTNPSKNEWVPYNSGGGAMTTLPQADPNGLFSPSNAEGTWVLLKDPNGSKTLPVYIEPRVVVTPFKFPSD